MTWTMYACLAAGLALIPVVGLAVVLWPRRAKQQPTAQLQVKLKTPVEELMRRARSDDERRMIMAQEAFMTGRMIIAGENDDGTWNVHSQDLP